MLNLNDKISFYYNFCEGDYKKSSLYFLKALKIREVIYKDNHPLLAASYNNFGYLLSKMGSYEEAKEYLLKALKIEELIYNWPPEVPPSSKYASLGSLGFSGLSGLPGLPGLL